MSRPYELYQEEILEHYHNPRNFHALAGANRSAEGYNPLCGDQITVYLRIDDDTIREISFQGSGCAIFQASASLMTVSVKGKTRKDAETLFQDFRAMILGPRERQKAQADLGDLVVFSSVYRFPVRVKCATLPWYTLQAALEGSGEPVSTE